MGDRAPELEFFRPAKTSRAKPAGVKRRPDPSDMSGDEGLFMVQNYD